MYGALLYLSYLWDLEDQRDGGDALKSKFGVVMQATRGISFIGEGFLTVKYCCIE